MFSSDLELIEHNILVYLVHNYNLTYPIEIELSNEYYDQSMSCWLYHLFDDLDDE